MIDVSPFVQEPDIRDVLQGEFVSLPFHRGAGAEGLRYRLCCSPTKMFFAAEWRSPVQPHPESALGRCVEGLWEYDIAELFLGTSTHERYLELHVDPRGAWWSASFLGYRERASAPPFELNTAVTAVAAIGGAVRAALSFPRSLLEDSSTALVVVTQRKMSCLALTSPPQSDKLDFHAKNSRIPLRF